MNDFDDRNDDLLMAWIHRPTDEALQEIEDALVEAGARVDRLMRRRAQLIEILDGPYNVLAYVVGSNRPQ